MNKVDRKTKVHVITPQGTLIEERTLTNSPWPELYPDRDMVIIDWMANTQIRPDEEAIATPVEYEGRIYYGNAYWGSAVKQGVTIGVTEHFLDGRMVKKAEDGQRVGRYLFAEGHWGAIQGKLRVRVSPINTMTPWGLIHDGAGFVRKGLADRAYSGLDKIRLGRAKESYTFWQRIPWTLELARELDPILSEAVMAASDISKLLLQYSPASFDEKRALYEADNTMDEHPYIVNAIARSSGEYLSRMATTANVGTRCGVIVPTQADIVIPSMPDGNPVIGYRHPIDSNGSIQAMVNSTDEAEFVSYGLSQFTLASGEIFAKGVSREVETDDFDVWLCDEDIKMSELPLEEVRREGEYEIDSIYAQTQRHKENTAVGMNLDKASVRQGADGDGDIEDIVDGNKYPALYSAVLQQPEGTTKKLVKSNSPLDERTSMIYKSMMNLVGFATKIMTDTLMVTDREYLADQLGYENEAEMDAEGNYHIKVGTDGFKTNIDQAEVRARLSTLQSNMLGLFGKGAPYSDWPNDQAFTRSIPQIWHEGMDDEDAIEAIMPWMDSTVPSISRRVLPGLQNVLAEPFKTRPLTTYKYWADHSTYDALRIARKMQDWYNANASEVNWQDAIAIQQFKLEWKERIADETLPRYELANALWFIAHGARSVNSGAGSVFLGFPEEALDIVLEKPGQQYVKTEQGYETVIVGLPKQCPNVLEMKGEVTIIDVPLKKAGKLMVRKAIVAVVEGQLQPSDNRYPENTIALVATNAFQPPAGVYEASITPNSEASHLIVLA